MKPTIGLLLLAGVALLLWWSDRDRTPVATTAAGGALEASDREPTGPPAVDPLASTSSPRTVADRVPVVDRVPVAAAEDRPADGRVLAVEVLDGDGNRLVGARVIVRAGPWSDFEEQARVAFDRRVDAGSAAVPLERGDTAASVQATAPGFAVAQTISLFGEGDPGTVSLVLEPGGVARLRLVDPKDEPVHDVQVQFDRELPGAEQLRFHRGLAAGEVLLVASQTGEYAAEFRKPGLGQARVQLTLALGDDVDLGDVVIGPGPTLRGRVRLADGTPAADIEVGAYKLGRRYRVGGAFGPFGTATTDAAGEFELVSELGPPLEVAVTGEFDPDGATYAEVDGADGWIELTAPSVLAVLRGGDPPGSAPLGRIDFTGLAEGYVDPSEITGRWPVAGFTRNGGGERELRILLPSYSAWKLVAEAVAGDDGAILLPESVAELRTERRSERIDVDLLPPTAPSNNGIEVVATVAAGIDRGISVRIGSDDTGQSSSGTAEPGSPFGAGGLRAGRYTVRAWADQGPSAPWDPSLKVVPSEVRLDLDGGGTERVELHLTRGGYLRLDLTAFSQGEELDPATLHPLDSTAWVELESDERALYPPEDRPDFMRIGPDGEVVPDDRSDYPLFGHRWRSGSAIAPGVYRVVVRPRGYDAWTATVELRPGEDMEVRPEPLPKSASD